MGYGIDVGTTSLKVVQLRRTMKGFRVLGAARRRVPKIDKPEDAKGLLSKALRETLGIREGQVGVVGLSGRDINLKLVQQPQMKAVNFRTMMGYEVDQARGSEGALYGDYCTLREPDPYFPNFLAMVGLGKVSYVDERISIAAASALDVRDAVPTPFALFTAYKNSYGDENGTTLLLDIGADNTDLALVRGGRLIFCRNVSSGARVFDQQIGGLAGVGPEEAEVRKIQFGTLGPAVEGADAREEEVRPAVRTAAGQIVGVIQSSINFAKTQLNDRELTVDKVYVSGGGARLKGLPEYLGSALKLPVEVLDPFRNVDLSGMGEAEEFKQLPTDMAEALGLAQISSEGKPGAVLSILPDALRKRRNFYRGTLFLVAGAVLTLLGIAGSTGVALYRRSDAVSELEKFRAETKAVTTRIDQLDRTEEDLRKLVAKRRMLDAHIAPGRMLLDTILKLRKTLPDGVFIRSVELVSLAEERQGRPVVRKVVFSYPGRGILEGVIQLGKGDDLSTEAELKIRLGDSGAHGEPESFAVGSMVGRTPIDAPWLAVLVKGDIDDNIKGTPGTVLDEMRLQFTDPVRGVAAEVFQEGSSSRPGWQSFRMMLRAD